MRWIERIEFDKFSLKPKTVSSAVVRMQAAAHSLLLLELATENPSPSEAPGKTCTSPGGSLLPSLQPVQASQLILRGETSLACEIIAECLYTAHTAVKGSSIVAGGGSVLILSFTATR